MTYEIQAHRLYLKEEKRLPPNAQLKLKSIISTLRQNPLLQSTNITPLKGESGVFRFRIGDWRLIYHLNHRQKTISLLAVRPRAGAYQL